MVAGPRRRQAACLSTAGKAEERKAIAQKTGHGFMGEIRKKQKTAKTTVFKTFDVFYGSRYQEKRQKKWWPVPESNWGHGDFQSPALPTELTCHFARSSPLLADHVLNIYPIFAFVKPFLPFFLLFFKFFTILTIVKVNAPPKMAVVPLVLQTSHEEK